MPQIERRLATLESKAATANAALKVVFVEEGETEAQAMQRAGYPLDAADVMRVVFVSKADFDL